MILPATVGPSRPPNPSPALKMLNSSGTKFPPRTSEPEEYMAAIIGPPLSPCAAREHNKRTLINLFEHLLERTKYLMDFQ